MKRISVYDHKYRIVSMILTIVMLLSMMPVNVFAATSGTLTTDIGEKEFVVGKTTEFTFTTVANDDAGTIVKGYFVFSNPDAIEKLEYKEVTDGNWYEFYGEFGPATGFPMSDVTSEFRVTFKQAGVYTLDASIRTVEDGTVICATTNTITVAGRSSITTDISNKAFVTGETTEFSYTTVANEDAGMLVRGSFVFSEPDAVSKLEYLNSADNKWYELTDDYGPVDGFILSENVISKFRVAFSKSGTYKVSFKLWNVETNDTLCFIDSSVTVKDRVGLSFGTKRLEIKYTDVNVKNESLIDGVPNAEYTYKSDNTAVVKVDDNGYLTPVSLGEATITVTRTENSGYTSASDSYVVKVSKGDQAALTWKNTVPSSIVWNSEEGYSNEVTGGTGDGEVTYTSDDASVASVDSKTGVLTMHKPGKVTIKATKSGGDLYEDIYAEYTLNIVKAKQTDLKFEFLQPDAIAWNTAFKNVATGGSGTGSIEYKSSDTDVAEVDENGNITGKQAGNVIITAYRKGDDKYEDSASASYSLTLTQVEQKDVAFIKGTENQKITFDQQEEYVNSVLNSLTAVSYKSSDDTIASVDSNGRVTAHKAGKVTITATGRSTNWFKKFTISYELEVLRADQEVVFEKGTTNINAIVYGDSYSNSASAKTDITYTSSDNSVAEVDNNGKLIVHKAGTVTITADAKGTEQYNVASDSYTITINKAEQEIKFKDAEPSVTFNDNENKFSNKASSNATVNVGNEDIDVTYSVLSGNEFIAEDSFDSQNGEFEIAGAGEIVIGVLFSENDRYNENSSSYRLTVGKDNQEIAFEKERYTMITGDKSFVTPTASEIGKYFGDAPIEYSYKDNTDGVLSGIDAESGKATFTNESGTVVIIATKPEDNNYFAAPAVEYTLTVSDLKANGEGYTLKGNKNAEDNEWFSSDVSIVANEGYLVSYEKNVNKADWKFELEKAATEDETKSVTFYIQNKENGRISKETIDIRKDATCPQIRFVNDEINGWDKVLYFLINGKHFSEETKNKYKIEISCSDNYSGCLPLEYYIQKDSDVVLDVSSMDELEWEKYTTPIYLAQDSVQVVYARVMDKAGNYAYASSKGFILDNNKASNIKFEIRNKQEYEFYKEDVIVDVYVEDDKPSSGLKSVTYQVKNNGTKTQGGDLFTFDMENPRYEDLVPSWDSKTAGNPIVVEADKNNSDNVTVLVTVTDNSGNVSTAEQSLKIYTGEIDLDVNFEYNEQEPVEKDGVSYYSEYQYAKVVFKGRKSFFTASEAPVIEVFEEKGDTANKVTYEIGEWVESPDETNPDESTYFCVMQFKGSAVYHFTVTFTDERGGKFRFESDKFAVDTDHPTADVSVDDSDVWSNLLKTLTFGIWKKSTVTVRTEPSDNTGYISSVDYYCDRSPEAPKTVAELNKITEWTSDNEFIIDGNGPFVVYVRVKDEVGNTTYVSSDGIIIDDTADDINISIKPEVSNENDVYSGDVEASIEVTQPKTSSGIKYVKYRIESDGIITEEKTLYSFEFERNKGAKDGTLVIKEDGEEDEEKQSYIPRKDDLRFDFSKNITIDSRNNDSGNVAVIVEVGDNAGNVKTERLDSLNVDVTRPQILLSYKENQPSGQGKDEYGYFNTDRTATITYTERNFDQDKATEGITITATDAKGKVLDISPDKMITWEEYVPGSDTHVAKINFTAEANYKLDIKYTDNAGHSPEKVETAQNSFSPFEFTIDKTAPTADVSVGENIWSELFSGKISYLFFNSVPVDVKIKADDEISPYKVYSYVDDKATEYLTAKELNEKKWSFHNSSNSAVSVSKDQIYSVYFKVVDSANNVSYFNSQGIIVDLKPHEIILEAEQTDHYHDDIPLYNEDVDIKINVKEPAKETASGIKKVEYIVRCEGKETDSGVLYEFKEENTSDNFKHEFSGEYTVDSELNNSCYVEFIVIVTDNAGNVSRASQLLDIDVTAPAIEVTYDNDKAYKTVGEKGYFPETREATVVITERAEHFNEEEAKKRIRITAVDGEGVSVMDDCSALISEWTHVASGDESTHTVKIDYSADANYTFEIDYTDLAGNDNSKVDTKSSVAPFEFAVDTQTPYGTVKVSAFDDVWFDIVEKLSFHLWTSDVVYLSATSGDKTTPVEEVYYYMSSDIEAKTDSDLDKVTEWAPFDGLGVYDDERFVAYLKIVDSAGNYDYISTNGIVVDTIAPVFDYVKPEITLTPQPSENGIYNSNVTIAVSVKEGDSISDVYSGIKTIEYKVKNMGEVTKSETLYNFENELPTYIELKRTWEAADAIVVDKNLNNSNDVVIEVTATDNAGNVSVEECRIKIDCSAPVINVSYDNNNGDSSFNDGVYFNADRRAKIEISERNFDPENVKVTITNSDGEAPKLSDWTVTPGNGNGDNTVYTSYIRYNKDGDYRFGISYTDNAGNKNAKVNYNGSLAPTKFTIDKTAPVVNVVYDNNDSRNGNYYAAQRTATITINEHNFETSRVRPSLVATDNGTAISAPVISGWTTRGDVHTATITFAADARYEFDFDYADKAGNKIADIPQQTFYVDKTNPVLSIQNIVDKSANNDEGNIGFVMVASDTNFDVFTPVVTAVVRNGNKIETKVVEIGELFSITNGARYVVENIETDGIYRIACTVVDKAGNAYTQVMLEKNDGTSYAEQRSGGNTLIEFSVNRDGSAYELDAATAELVEKYYVQNVTGDVVITEVNADPLESYEVVLNGEVLNNDQYAVAKSGGNGSWMKYVYTVKKENFAEEKEYKLVVSSKDKAENTAFSDLKETSVEFVVDRTAPVISVSGLADNGRYQTEKQIVTIVPTDDGGKLNTLIVNMVDADGNFIKEVINLSGEELLSRLEENDNKITFEIPEGLYQNVQIICTDCAMGGSEDTDDTNVSETFIKNVSVSTSGFMIFWASKPLRWGTIGGVGLLAVGIIVFIILKKKKKKEA